MKVWFYEILGMCMFAEDLLASQKWLTAWSCDIMDLVGHLIG
jgi:hypothetical protein